ncbi:MAG: DUF3987 domain-containing protein, partial [Gemmatimonadota bacterium]|nr:DUF3987 domain-containing protein [Gemmatimonadota bacterium]
MTASEVVARFPGATRNGGGWTARCPAHEDRRASLSVGGGTDGRVLLHCHAGCPPDAVANAAGLTIADLFADAPSGNGKASIVAEYDYTDEAGELLFQAVRLFPKDFRQRRPDGGGGWAWKLGDVRRVPYRLPELVDAVRAGRLVFVVEGERDADRLHALDFAATCNAGGAGKWAAPLSEHFRGARVVILPDNDEPGRQHAVDVAAKLHGIASGVRIVELPGLPPKGDVSDWLDSGGTVEQLKERVRAAPLWTPESVPAAPLPAPTPLMRKLAPAEPFPVGTLGDVLGSAAAAIHEQVQAPLAICGQSVLAAATLAVQGHADVELPTRQAKPLSGFFVTVAASGERKSACDAVALWPVRKREAALRAAHDAERPAWENLRDSWEKQRAQILGNRKQYPNAAAKHAALNALGPLAPAPLDPLLTCPEPSFEGLTRLLGSGQPAVGVFSAEGGQFVGGFGMSQEHRLKTAAALSGLWDGEPVKRVRAGDGTIVLPGRRVALHLMMQTDVAAELLSDRMLADQGLLSRMLVVAPASTAGARLWKEPTGEGDEAIRRYDARLLDILEAPLPLAKGKPNELTPRRLPLTPAARTTWTDFADHIERQLAPGAALDPIRGLANKLPEHAARLAGVLALVEDLNAGEIGKAHLDAGIGIVQHFASEALRLFEGGRADPELQLAARVLAWLQSEWKEPLVSAPDLYQRGPNAVRDARTARRQLAILEDHGWL